MDWTYNVPVKFCEYDLNEFKNRLNTLKGNILLIASKRVIETFEIDTQNFTLIDKSINNPDIHLVGKVLKNLEKPDLIVAVGGGSTIDIAKAISALYDYRHGDVLTLISEKKYLDNENHIPIIAVPTTAGTGSECTKWATIWDFDNLKKYSVDVDYLYPKEAWLIAELTQTMNYEQTLSTGLDALSHAMESYWSRPSNRYTRVLARDSIRIIAKYLPLVLDDLNNTEYRHQMMMGSFFAGLAFSNTRTTASHSISYPLTMKYNVGHGYAVAVTLFEVMRRNWPYIKEKDEFLKAWAVESVDGISEWFRNITKGEITLEKFGIKKEDIADIVKLATTGGRMDNNPVVFDEDEIRDILESVY